MLFWVRFVPQAVSVDHAVFRPSSPAQAPVRPSSLSHSQIRCRDKSGLAKTVCTDVSIRFALMLYGYRSTGCQHPCSHRCTMPKAWLHIHARASVIPLLSPNTHIYCNFYYRSASDSTHVKRPVHILVRLANHDARLLFMRHCHRVPFSCFPPTFIMSVGRWQERQLDRLCVCHGEQRAMVFNRQ